MSIMDIFSSFRPAASKEVAPEDNKQITAPVPNPGDPVAFKAAPTPGETKSPLEPYANLWNNVVQDNKNAPPSLVPQFNIDQAKLAETVGKMDFTQGISQELLSKAMSGSDPASLVAVMNNMVQAAYVQGLNTQTGLVKEAFTRHADTLTNHILPTTVQGIVRQASTTMPDYMASPAIAPLVGAINEMFARQHPNATPAQIADHTKGYLKTLGMEVLKNEGMVVSAPSKAQIPGLGNQPEVDWSAWLNRS